MKKRLLSLWLAMILAFSAAPMGYAGEEDGSSLSASPEEQTETLTEEKPELPEAAAEKREASPKKEEHTEAASPVEKTSGHGAAEDANPKTDKAAAGSAEAEAKAAEGSGSTEGDGKGTAGGAGTTGETKPVEGSGATEETKPAEETEPVKEAGEGTVGEDGTGNAEEAATAEEAGNAGEAEGGRGEGAGAAEGTGTAEGSGTSEGTGAAEGTDPAAAAGTDAGTGSGGETAGENGETEAAGPAEAEKGTETAEGTGENAPAGTNGSGEPTEGTETSGETEGAAETEEEAPAPQLSKATDLKTTSEGLTSVTLTFRGDPAPTRYRVYRATAKKGKYKSLGYAWEAEEGSGDYLFEDRTAKRGNTYYYKVRAVIPAEDGDRWGEEYSAIVSGKPKPASVGKVTGESTSASSIKITWNKVSYATGYQIGRSTNLYSGYKTICTGIAGSKLTYTDKTAKVGGQYYYRVRAYYDPAGGSRVYGPYTYSGVVLCEPAAPTKFRVSKNTETTVTLAWTAAKGVSYYNVRYSWVQAGKVTYGETMVGLSPAKKSCTVANLEPAKEYTFQIWSIAFTSKGDEMRSGVAQCVFQMPEETPKGSEEAAPPIENPVIDDDEEPEEETEAAPAEEPEDPEEDEEDWIEKELSGDTPEISGYDVTAAGIQIAWQAVPGTESYRVERSAKRQSGYKTLAQGITDPGYLDTGITLGKGYYYRVIALDGAGNEITGAPKGVFAAKAKALTAKKGSDGYYTFTWSAQKNADQYRIYRSEDGGAFKKVKTVAATEARSWKDTGIVNGKTYTYYVQAWTTADGKRIAGAKGTEKSMYIGVRENPVIRVEQAATTIQLSWEKVENASGYVIYGAQGDGQLAKLAKVKASATAWSQTPPAASGYLKYYVRAYAVVGGKNKYAPPSEPVTIRRLARPQLQISQGEETDTLSVYWSGIDAADGYRVYYRRNPEEAYQSVETTERQAVIPAEGGSTASVYVRAIRREGETLYEGSPSVTKSCTPYWKYALLIGNANYTAKSSLTRLAATAADVAGFSVVLNRQNGWKVNACANMTGEEILTSIARFFGEADENCTCLFYYSGHGLQGRDARTGSLCGIDGSYVTLAELKAALDRVPGKSIVLMDSCGSGAAVENDSGAETLDDEKYSVVTAAEAYQSSFASAFHSYFTYYLAFGSGYDYDTKRVLASQPADTDKDGTISFRELVDYIAKYLSRVSTVTEKLPEPEASVY